MAGQVGCVLGYGAAMPREDSKSLNASQGRLGFILGHPIIFTVFVACTLVGAAHGGRRCRRGGRCVNHHRSQNHRLTIR
jgi:hypothetical protein